MPDITMLKLADHEWFREQFAQRDNLQARASVRKDALEKVWRPLADKLDVHAYIEEKIFYPQLLTRGVDDPTAKRSMRSAITTTSVTVFRTPMRRRLALTSGGRRSRERVRRMTSTWARRNAKDYQTFHPQPRPAGASQLLRAGPPARPATVLTALRFSRLAGSLSPSAATRTAVSGHAFPRSVQTQQTGLTSPICRTPPGQSAVSRQTHPGLPYCDPVLMSPD